MIDDISNHLIHIGNTVLERIDNGCNEVSQISRHAQQAHF